MKFGCEGKYLNILNKQHETANCNLLTATKSLSHTRLAIGYAYRFASYNMIIMRRIHVAYRFKPNHLSGVVYFAFYFVILFRSTFALPVPERHLPTVAAVVFINATRRNLFSVAQVANPTSYHIHAAVVYICTILTDSHESKKVRTMNSA